MSQNQKNTSSFSLPHNDEAERATIGAMLLEKSALYEVIDFLKPEMFYDQFMKEVYTAILSVETTSEVDLITVTKELQKNEKGIDVYRLATLSEEVTSASHIKYHAAIVYQDFMRRQFTLKCAQSLNDSSDISIDVDDLISKHIFDIENLLNVSDIAGATPIDKIASEAMRGYQARAKKAEAGEPTGIHTGLRTLDKALHSFQPGCVYVLAARPGMGKTAFMLHIARKTAEQGNAVLVFSLEMTKRSLIDRMVIAASGIDSSSYKNGRLIPDEVYSMGLSLERLSTLPIHVNDTASISIQQIKAEAKKLKRKGKCDIVLIDYLQLIDTHIPGKTKNDEVAALSRSIKVMAKDLDVPVVLLSQLNRGVEGRSNKIPMLSDLRDSGAIEQDADAVLFIHRESYYTDNANRNEGIIRIAKNREESTGDVCFWVSDDVTNFKDKNEKPF